MRLFLATQLALHLVLCLFFSSSLFAQTKRPQATGRQSARPVVSQNFVVHSADPILAHKVSIEAERFRKELAIEWLGRELKPWSQKCPITVQIGMHAGGETSFAFVTNESGRGQPIDWQMKIFGPPNRLLDAVLPHEVTHTIFATHFGRPLPRWADEGACTTVEHESERKKNHAMLMDFLHAQPSRGLPFNRMFTMRNYPHDILPLYAQGYSVAKFLILQKGRRHFLDYIGSGLQKESRGAELRAWDQATTEFYSYEDLSDLQVAWLDWVRKGSSESAIKGRDQAQHAVGLAQAETRRSPNQVSVAKNFEEQTATPLPLDDSTQTFATSKSGSWYAQEMNKADGDRIAANRQDLPTKTRKVSAAAESTVPPPVFRDSSLPAEFRATPSTIWR